MSFKLFAVGIVFCQNCVPRDKTSSKDTAIMLNKKYKFIHVLFQN